MKITKRQLRQIIREAIQLEAGRVTVGPKNLAMIDELRGMLGDDDFIMLLASKLNALELKDALRKVAAERELKVGGVQYF